MRCPNLSELPPPPPTKTGWPWTEEYPQLPDTMPSGQAWPKVSIVTPSYNQGRFIEETIRSVLLQGYPDLEYIVIDGASTDESADIIHKYEPWLAYWVSEPDGGQSEAINKGFARTTGAILTWLNSDDRFQPGAFQAGVTALQVHPEAGVVYGDFTYIDEQSRLLSKHQSPDFKVHRQIVALLMPQPAAFFRRIVWETVGPLKTKFHYVMDHDFWNRTALHFPINHFPNPIADIRMHSGTKMVAQTIHFLYEQEMLFDDFFALPDLPLEIQALEAEARGANYFGIGRRHLGSKQYPEARQAFARAWHTYPLNLNKLMILPFWLDSILKTNFATPLFRLAVWLKHGIWLRDENKIKAD